MFTPMEGSNRVPFIIRWSGRVPADRETDAIVHEVDTFTTLLRFVGADVPTDRPIDGVDRNYKLHFVWQVHATDPVLSLGVPLVFNLLNNPQENPDENLATTHLWVVMGASRMIGEFQDEPQKHPPITSGASDPYVPPEQPVAAA